MNDYKSVFIDNDKPELINGFPKEPVPHVTPEPVPYHPDQHRPCPPPEYIRPDFPARYPERVINPVPNVKRPCPPPPPMPPHPHCPEHHLYPRRPIEWREDGMYVTKHELNRILHNIAEADIFTDLTTTGTTVSLGGITKGTKLSKITFAQLVDKLLYPKDGTEGAYVTQGELEEALENIEYDSLLNKPTEFDFTYPAKDESGQITRNYIVTNALGGFKVGDDLSTLSIVDIIEKLLCGDNNPWGGYTWKTEAVAIENPSEITDGTIINALVADFASEGYITDEQIQLALASGMYSLYTPCASADIDNLDVWNYDSLIANDQAKNAGKQTTVAQTDIVDADTVWSYNSTDHKINISSTGSFDIAANRVFVLVKRKKTS